jgi:hypothetical protein
MMYLLISHNSIAPGLSLIILYHISISNRVELVRLFYSPGLVTV